MRAILRWLHERVMVEDALNEVRRLGWTEGQVRALRRETRKATLSGYGQAMMIQMVARNLRTDGNGRPE